MIKNLLFLSLLVAVFISPSPAVLAKNSIIKKEEVKTQNFACIDPRKDKETIRSVISSNYLDGYSFDQSILNYIDIHFLKDRQFILSTNHVKLNYIDKSLSDDKEVVMKMVRDNGLSLEYASDRLKNNIIIAQEAITNNFKAFYYIDKDLMLNRDMALFAVKKSGFLLQDLDLVFTKDKELVLAAVKQYGKALEYADESLKKDIEVVLAAVQNNGLALEFAAPFFFKNNEVILTAVKNNSDALKFIDDNFKKDKSIILTLMQSAKGSMSLEYASKDLLNNRDFVLEIAKSSKHPFLGKINPSFRSDKEIALLAVQNRGMELKYVDDALRKDRKVVLTAIKNNGNALIFANEQFKRDKAIVLSAIEHGLDALSYLNGSIDKSIKKDREILAALLKKDPYILVTAHEIINKAPSLEPLVIEVIRKNPTLIKYASQKIKKYKLLNNKDFVLSMVKKNGRLIAHANVDLRKDIDVIRESVKTYGMGIQYAVPCPPSVGCINPSKDKEIVRSAISENFLKGSGYYNHKILDLINKKYLKDRQFILSTNNIKIHYIDKSLSDDREVVMKMVKDNGLSLEYASKRLQKDKEIVQTAIKNNPSAFHYIDESLENDKDIVLFAVKESGYLLRHVDLEYLNNKEVVLAAVTQFGKALEYANDRLKDDKNIVLAAVKNDGQALKFADLRYQKDKEVVLAATSSDSSALLIADKHFKSDIDIILAIIQSKKGSLSLDYIDKNLLQIISKDKTFIMKLANISQRSFLQYMNPNVRKDKAVVLRAVTKRGIELKFADSSLAKDNDIVLAAIKSNGNALSHANKQFKQDKTTVLLAIENGLQGSEYMNAVDPSIQEDHDLLAAILQKKPLSLRFLSKLMNKDPMLETQVLEALSRAPFLMDYASNKIKKKELLNKKDYVLSLVKTNGSFIEYAGNDLKYDIDVIREAVKTYAMALQYSIPCSK